MERTEGWIRSATKNLQSFTEKEARGEWNSRNPRQKQWWPQAMMGGAGEDCRGQEGTLRCGKIFFYFDLGNSSLTVLTQEAQSCQMDP